MPVFVCAGPVCSECGRSLQVKLQISHRTGRKWPVAFHPADNLQCINAGKFYYMPQCDEIDGPFETELKEVYAKS